MEHADFWIEVVWKLWTVGLTFYVAINKGTERLTARIDKVEKDLSGYGQRLTTLAGKVDALPTIKDIGEIHEKINAVHNQLSKLTGEFESNETLLRAIHQKLMGH